MFWAESSTTTNYVIFISWIFTYVSSLETLYLFLNLSSDSLLLHGILWWGGSNTGINARGEETEQMMCEAT